MLRILLYSALETFVLGRYINKYYYYYYYYYLKWCPTHFGIIIYMLLAITVPSNATHLMAQGHHQVLFITFTRNDEHIEAQTNYPHFTDDIFKWFFLNENVWISPKISLKFVPKIRINNIPTLVQIMAWCLPGDKPLSETMLVSLARHICVTQPHWVNIFAKVYLIMKCFRQRPQLSVA